MSSQTFANVSSSFCFAKNNQGLSKVLPNFNLALSFSFANV
jgi:hypothetical protein